MSAVLAACLLYVELPLAKPLYVVTQSRLAHG